MGLGFAMNFCVVCPFPSHIPLGFSISESCSEHRASRSGFVGVLTTTSWCQNSWRCVQRTPAEPLLAPSCCCKPRPHAGRGSVRGIAASLVNSWVMLNKDAN